MNSYCKNQELTKEPTLHKREAVQKIIRLLKELNAALSLSNEIFHSLQNLWLWLVALFLFLLFSIFVCFPFSYSSHVPNHPFVFPCSHVHSLASQPSGLNRASASGNFSVSSASQRAHVYFQNPHCWKHSSLQA